MKRASESAISNSENQTHGASMAPVEDGRPLVSDESEPAIDDQGTDQFEAAEILQRVRQEAFDSSDEKLAIALGRSPDEIAEWVNGEGKIDSDALMKAKALASERGVELG